MKTVCKKDMCAGCMACVEICPKNAVSVEDTIGEYNAVIDTEKCVNCGLCHKTCQENNPPKLIKPIYWKEGWTDDEKLRAESSSGGFASAISLAFVKNGGIVCSCCFNENGFGFSFAENETDVKRFTGSKYVKSNPYGIYKRISSYINDGKKLLFIGLPCQAAAVKNYIGNSDKLYTVDLICHGSPSPKILESFLSENQIAADEKLSFRNKEDFHLEYGGKRLTVSTVRDMFTRSFLEGSCYTQNCYNCKYAGLERVSDLTLGDSWGSQLSKEEQKKGISLALCQSEKGKQLLKEAKLNLYDVDLDRAVEFNRQLNHPSELHPKRALFISGMKSGKGFKKSYKKCFPKRYMKHRVYTVLYKLGIKR